MTTTLNTATSVLNHLLSLPVGSIIFVDIDDTIITPLSNTFRAPPHNKMIDNIKNNKESYHNYEEIISNWRLQRSVILVDETWPEIIEALKLQHKVYGLTKMDSGTIGNIPCMEEWRYNELKKLGIEFSDSDVADVQYRNTSIFYRGIFMTGTLSKSATVEKYKDFLGLESISAKQIVMIDDRLEWVQNVEEFAQRQNIGFIGILFDGIKNLSGEPDPKIADIQYRHLTEHSTWLEDADAAALLPIIAEDANTVCTSQHLQL
jgi:hypothetical protein